MVAEPNTGIDHSLQQERACDFNYRELERNLRKPRSLFSMAMTAFTALLTLTAITPLFSVLYMLLMRGGRRLSWESLSELPPTAFQDGGGFGNAIVGTLVMVSIGALLTVPSGILTAVFLAEFGSDTRVAGMVRFCAKVLTGFPSILAGVFVYGILVAATGTPSSIAGGIALAVLMLPTIMLTAEEAIRMVPKRMREAAIGMGATPTQTVWKVTLPTAIPGILTGIMLAVARAAGETAPLLFTALMSNYWIITHGKLELMQPTASLAVLIYNFSGVPFDNQKELAWTAALVLVLIVLAANLTGQVFSRRVVRD